MRRYARGAVELWNQATTITEMAEVPKRITFRFEINSAKRVVAVVLIQLSNSRIGSD